MTTSAQSDSRIVAQRYRLQRVVGRGAMGAVWAAEDTVLHRTVALKEVVLPPGLSREDRAVACERTFREARAIARLAHPNVVTLYDVVEEDKRPWVVMELVPARSLAQVLKDDGPLDPTRAAKVGLAVLGALQAAHEAGITHRDVKPGNILIAEDGRVKLTDFGIARAAGDMTLTGTGLLVGSPSYMAPEVVRGEELRPTADMFGLGATLYCAVEGHPPFSGGDAISTLNAVVGEPPAPYKRAGILTPVLNGLLEKDPRARLTAARARQMLLDTVRENDPRAARETSGGDMLPVRATNRLLPDTRIASGPAAGQIAGQVPGQVPAAEATQAMRQPIPSVPPGWGPPPGQPPGPPLLLPTGEAPGRYGDVFAPRPAATRGYGKIIAIVAICIALVVGGLVLSQVMGSDSTTPTGNSHTAGPDNTRPKPGSVPAGYTRYTDPDGRFTVAVPRNWNAARQGTAIQFGDPTADRFLRIYDEPAPRRPQTAFGEHSFRKTHDGYQRIRLAKVDYRGLPAAEWEFTYVRSGVTRHVLWRGFIVGDRLYGVYLSTPDDQFDASRAYFSTAAATFRTT
ncbi:MAG TPA: serine/threonine-protein kinase [Mycobacteriales bacterium]|nr:serine/threonine-protein kinase [Mycobacteriales bacterium]